MVDTSLDIRLRATMVGPIAARTLRSGARGLVRAVFERSFYAFLGTGWICVGSESLGAGPLNLLCAPWHSGLAMHPILRVGDAVCVDNGVLYAGDFRLSVHTAQLWQPEPPGVWNNASLTRGLASFEGALPPSLPDEGLARLLRCTGTPSPATPLMTAAKSSISYLEQLLGGAATSRDPKIDAARIAPLLGLGPGLTPSGDDFLAGVLVARSLTERARLRDRLWQAVEPLLTHHTSDISHAHLAAAAEGFGGAALHELLCAILAGATDTKPPAIAAVTAIGHTSGWDALAGAISALRTHNPLTASSCSSWSAVAGG
jgi:hypothetical protein